MKYKYFYYIFHLKFEIIIKIKFKYIGQLKFIYYFLSFYIVVIFIIITMLF